VSYFIRIVDFQLLRSVDANLRHTITRRVTITTCSLFTFIQVSFRKVKVKLLEDTNNTRISVVPAYVRVTTDFKSPLNYDRYNAISRSFYVFFVYSVFLV
jgi:hypothetical protein